MPTSSTAEKNVQLVLVQPGRRDQRFDQMLPGGQLGERPNTGLAFRPLISDAEVSHPGYGLVPETIVSIYRQAELGFPRRQVQLFDDLVEGDGHLWSLVDGRTSDVAGRLITVLPGADDSASTDAAEALREHLEENLNFTETVAHQLQHRFQGWSATELLWRQVNGMWMPDEFLNVPHDRFAFDPVTDELRLVNSLHDWKGESLAPGKWMVSRAPGKRTARRGYLRCAAWFAMFKRMDIRDWVIIMEKFGIPAVLAKYDEEAGIRARQVVETAMADLGEAGHAVVSSNVSVEFHWPDYKGAESIHERLLGCMNSEMSKLINGATLTSETSGPGSYALGDVHDRQKFKLVQADARHLAAVFRRDVSRPFCRYNPTFSKARPPRLHIQLARDQSSKERLEAAKTLGELGLPLDKRQLYEDFGFRAPARAEDKLEVPQKGPTGPGGQNPRNAE